MVTRTNHAISVTVICLISKAIIEFMFYAWKIILPYPRNRPTQYLLRLQIGRNPTRTTSNPRHAEKIILPRPRNRPTQYLLRLQIGRNPTRTTSNPKHSKRSFFRVLEIDRPVPTSLTILGGIQLVRPRIPGMPKRSFFRFLEIDQHSTYFAYKLGGIQLVRPRIPDM
ncbi:hypothetical protein CDAR_411 [Caerostris darwini]|uniref:Uncharacterized protein n=1 Tax=Caerostris darwini TaxID=1538125 RepID=A0AAV4UCG5_9ARAC|nr:hypothetical protein CDAR_411 [Caerostris darwini]